MAIATAFHWPNAVQFVLAIVLAFLFGYSLTLWPVLRAGLSLKQATGVALAADTVAMHGRQVSVEDDDVVVGGGRALQRCRAVVHGVHGHPGLAQPLSDPAGQRRMVLDHQHPHPASMRRTA